MNVFGENPQDVTKLDPELSRYLYDHPIFGRSLKHPLVFQIPFISWKLANDSFAAKKKKVEELMAAGKYDSAIWLYERPYRLPTLAEWYEEKTIDLDQLRAILPDVWMDVEEPQQYEDLPLELFEEAGYVSDTNKKLTGILTLYRGGTEHTDEIGIEWSLSYGTAMWFARRFDNPKPVVMRAEVKSENILAYLVGRGEEEVIVNPENLKNVKRVY